MKGQCGLFSYAVMLGCLAWTTSSLADDGQALLDQAMGKMASATKLAQLSEVISLCEQAIEKGLSSEDEDFARDMLAGALYRRSQQLSLPVLQAPRLNAELQQLRKRVLSDLEKIVKIDDKAGRAYLLMAQVRASGGSREQKLARAAIDRAITLLKGEKQPLAMALLLRGQLQESDEQRLADINRALKTDPDSAQAWRARATYYVRRGEFQKAIDDFNTLLEKDSSNVVARLAVAEALMNVKKFDESRRQIDRVIEERPNPIAYTLRAQLWMRQNKFDQAINDLNSAMELAPGDLGLLLMRARLYHAEERNALAKQDVDRVLAAEPRVSEAIELRSSIAASLGRFEEALADVETLLDKNPENVGLKLQLAIYANAAGNSRRAVKLFSEVLGKDPGNGVAFRGRADAYLNLGNHAKAVKDYEVALKSQSGDSWILNNFAWVLATSPDEEIRDGKRAVELGRKACEATEFKEAHIISTLAAAYAEVGDFDEATKWSRKAVELSDESVVDQLKKELESYLKKKPWRERKQEEPKKDPKEQGGTKNGS